MAEVCADDYLGLEGEMRLPRRRRWQLDDDEGVSLIEVMVACVVLSAAVLSVVGAMGSGMGLVGHSRQRTAGAGVAQERLERARNVAYEDLALNEDPTHIPTPIGHPDNNVIEGSDPGPSDDRYRLSDGTEEPLIIDTGDGGLRHLDDPFTLAQTEFTVHQYVTWRDGSPEVGDTQPTIPGTQSYKRVIVVVTWKFPVHSGPKHTIVESTFVTDGTIDVPTPTPSTPPPIPTVDPSPPIGGDDDLGVGTFFEEFLGGLLDPPNGSSDCPTDVGPGVDGPSFESGELLSGSGTDQGYLNSTSVDFRFDGADPECHPITLFMANKASADQCTNANGFVEVQQLEGGQPPPVNVTWQVPAGDGYKAVCAVFQNKSGEASRIWAVNVKLDQTPPSAPQNFDDTDCDIVGNNREIDFSWSQSTDSNFYGYRLYRSVESAAFQLEELTSTTTSQDVVLKNYSSVRYFVRAYDKAGNESASSSVISYSKNQC